MLYVVIRPWGFMEAIEKESIGPKDEVVYKGTPKECSKFIHGGR